MKRFSLWLFFFLAAISVFAKQITEGEAMAIAQKFMQGKALQPGQGGVRIRSIGQTQFKNFYVFNVEAAGGFVIVSGDDRMQSILGYSNKGRIDMANLPCNMKWLLDCYDRTITDVIATGRTVSAAPTALSAKADINPMITTQWGQGAPYNELCPQIGDQRCLTGCVATAMAQVINYHRWPQAETAAVPSYTSTSAGIAMPTLAKTQFDWNNMSSTSIAKLMLYCGQAVKMDYGVDASGAPSVTVPNALTATFGFNDNIGRVTRSGYTDAQWDEKVYDELSAGRPVLYFGQSEESGGHAFIVDGYSDGRFHLNWGWDGYCDGYFTLDNLKPTYAAGFNTGQEIIVNVCPPDEAGEIDRPKASVTAMACGQKTLERSGAGVDFPAFTVESTVKSNLSETATMQLEIGRAHV